MVIFWTTYRNQKATVHIFSDERPTLNTSFLQSGILVKRFQHSWTFMSSLLSSMTFFIQIISNLLKYLGYLRILKTVNVL